MNRLNRWVVLCSAVVILSGIFAGRAIDAPLATRTSGPAPSADLVEQGAAVAARTAPGTGADRFDAPSTVSTVAAPAATIAAPSADAYPGSRVDRKAILALHGNQPLSARHPHMAAAIEVQKRHREEFFAHPAVVGTAVGLNDEGQVAILVMTKDAAEDLPRSVENTPVVIWRTGEIFALNQEAATADGKVNPQGKPGGGGSGGGTPAPTPITQTRFSRPVPIGVSTSLAVDYTLPYITAGTLGCRVTDGTSVFALSNNHVYANESTAPIGAAVLQPGTLDKGVAGDQFGALAAYAPITFTRRASNVIDAAISLSSVGNLGNSTPAGIGYGVPSKTPAIIDDNAVGKTVRKCGRTTGYTSGTISGVNATVIVRYDHGQAAFVSQVMVSGSGFSAGGDSGSLIVTDGDFAPMALLFAGGSSTTFGNPIGAVLSYFSVSVDGQ